MSAPGVDTFDFSQVILFQADGRSPLVALSLSLSLTLSVFCACDVSVPPDVVHAQPLLPFSLYNPNVARQYVEAHAASHRSGSSTQGRDLNQNYVTNLYPVGCLCCPFPCGVAESLNHCFFFLTLDPWRAPVCFGFLTPVDGGTAICMLPLPSTNFLTTDIFKFVFRTTWGDPHYLGLNGFEFYDVQGRSIPISSESCVVCDCAFCLYLLLTRNCFRHPLCHLRRHLCVPILHQRGTFSTGA